MAPVRSYSNWNSRATDSLLQGEPYRKYFFICEGANTETWYFRKLVDLRKMLNIHPVIDLRLLEKTEGDRDISYPQKLINFAESQKSNPDIRFDEERDKMVIVFDADIFEKKVNNYNELILRSEQTNILAISNPAFELFLLLHYKGSYENVIIPNESELIKNEKDGNQTFIYRLLLGKTGMNSKKNPKIGDLAFEVETAIFQEKQLNQNIHDCKGKLTCNIGQIIESIRNDDGT